MQTNRNQNAIDNFLRIPDVVTLAGLSMAVGSMFASLGGHLYVAAALILGGVLCDFFDGRLARRLGQDSPFGAAMDGFNDFATHLLAVVIFTYSAGLTSPLAIFCYSFFVALGAIRLSRYAVTGTVDGCYEGLPVSYSFALVPLTLYFRARGLPLEPLLLLYVVPAFLMISCIRIKKPFTRAHHV